MQISEQYRVYGARPHKAIQPSVRLSPYDDPGADPAPQGDHRRDGRAFGRDAWFDAAAAARRAAAAMSAGICRRAPTACRASSRSDLQGGARTKRTLVGRAAAILRRRWCGGLMTRGRRCNASSPSAGAVRRVAASPRRPLVRSRASSAVAALRSLKMRCRLVVRRRAQSSSRSDVRIAALLLGVHATVHAGFSQACAPRRARDQNEA